MALVNLAMNDDKCKSIGEKGGIDMILKMMETHGESNAQVAEYGCRALANLAMNADNCKSIGEKGGIDMLLKMMERHGNSNAQVAEYGCLALARLADLAMNQDFKNKIIGANGLFIVKHMKKLWANNAGVQQNAGTALSILCSNNGLTPIC
jgi:hypothetical protein